MCFLNIRNSWNIRIRKIIQGWIIIFLSRNRALGNIRFFLWEIRGFGNNLMIWKTFQLRPTVLSGTYAWLGGNGKLSKIMTVLGTIIVDFLFPLPPLFNTLRTASVINKNNYTQHASSLQVCQRRHTSSVYLYHVTNSYFVSQQ